MPAIQYFNGSARQLKRANSLLWPFLMVFFFEITSTQAALVYGGSSFIQVSGLNPDDQITELDTLFGTYDNFVENPDSEEFNGAYSYSANTDFKVKQVKANAEVSGQSISILTMYNQVIAQYTDEFIFTATDLDGQPVAAGSFTAQAHFSGTATASGGGLYNAFAAVGGSVSINNIGGGPRTIATASGLGVNSPREMNQVVPVTVTWVSGLPIIVQMRAVAEAQGSSSDRFGSAPGSFAATANIFNTIEWGGITDVKDQDGNAVASFTALNADGVDYATGFAAVVPLPGGVWLLVSALGLLGWMKRRIA